MAVPPGLAGRDGMADEGREGRLGMEVPTGLAGNDGMADGRATAAAAAFSASADTGSSSSSEIEFSKRVNKSCPKNMSSEDELESKTPIERRQALKSPSSNSS